MLQPHGWPDPDLEVKPPGGDTPKSMPSGWSWQYACLGDLLDAAEYQELTLSKTPSDESIKGKRSSVSENQDSPPRVST